MPTIRGLGAVQPHVKAAAEEIAAKFQIYNIGGKATSGHINGSDHYVGLAIDVMTYADDVKGMAIWNYAITNADRLGVKYVIHDRKIWQAGKITPYVGTSPHTDHVHISFHKSPGTGGAPVDSSAGTSDADGCLGQFVKLLSSGSG